MLKPSLFLRPFVAAPLLLTMTLDAQKSTAAAPEKGAPPATQAPATSAIYPMEADLVQSLGSKTLQTGGHVLAKLAKDWTDGTCRLARGAVVRGDVLRFEPWSPATHRIEVTLLFHYTCPGADPQALTWIALLAPEDPDLAGLHDGNPVAVQSFRSSSFGGAGNIGSPTGAAAGTPGDQSGRQNPNLPVFLGPAADHSHPRPSAIKTGQVWRVPDVSLHVGAGPDDSTVLEAKGKSLHVPAGSAVVLLPAAVAVVESASASSPAANTTVAPPKPEAPRFVEITACARPACTVAPAPPGSGNDISPAQSLSLRGLRYNRQRSAEMRKLDFGTAMAFLGPNHLLVTFDPHTLVTREAEDRPEDRPHMVHAVLFNLGSGHAERTLDWRVPDSRQYLWPVTEDRVLIHSGRRLVWLGAGLHQQTAFSPDGSVAFVRMSPDRRHVAVGVLRELHSREEHAEMAAADVNGPEEQVAVHLLNAQLEPISRSEESSRALPPVLSDRGRVVLLHAGGQHWRYKLMRWDETAREAGEPIASVSSACVPQMSSLASGLLLIAGCEGRSLDHWYRVMRPDGSLVLKGVLHPQDLAPLPAEETAEGRFVVALPAGGPGYARGSSFRAEDIASEVVRVHRATDGEPLLSVRVRQPAPANQSFALTSAGDRLAVLDGDEIHIYPLEHAPGSSLTAATAASTVSDPGARANSYRR